MRGLRLGLGLSRRDTGASVAPPEITAQPTGGNYQRTAVTLSVTADGDDLTYQWESSAAGAATWAAIGGATNSTYDASPTADTDYRVIISNAADEVTSDTATVLVANMVALKAIIAARGGVLVDCLDATTETFQDAARTTPATANDAPVMGILPSALVGPATAGLSDLDATGAETLLKTNLLAGGRGLNFTATSNVFQTADAEDPNFYEIADWYIGGLIQPLNGASTANGLAAACIRADSLTQLAIGIQSDTGDGTPDVFVVMDLATGSADATTVRVATTDSTWVGISAFFDGTNLFSHANSNTRTDHGAFAGTTDPVGTTAAFLMLPPASCPFNVQVAFAGHRGATSAADMNLALLHAQRDMQLRIAA